VQRRLAPLWVLFPLLAGCGPNRAAFAEASALPPPSAQPYRLQAADVLEVAFYRTPELTQERTVGPDGAISLLLVGQVQAAGRTVDELTDVVRGLYQNELTSPDVTIAVQGFSGLQVYVAGEVATPGMVPYRGGLTLVQALFSAGGFLPTASQEDVVVIRRGPDGEPVGSLVNVDRVLDDGVLGDDVPLAASDIVFVSRSAIANVNLFIQQYIRNNIPVPIALGYDLGTFGL